MSFSSTEKQSENQPQIDKLNRQIIHLLYKINRSRRYNNIWAEEAELREQIEKLEKEIKELR